jgi:NTE family protein
VGNIEFEWDKFVAVQLQAQLALTQSSIILLRFAAAQDADFYTELLDNKTLLGASLSYYFNSLPGPIGASVGYSNVTKEPYFNINLGYVF